MGSSKALEEVLSGFQRFGDAVVRRVWRARKMERRAMRLGGMKRCGEAVLLGGGSRCVCCDERFSGAADGVGG